MNTIIGLFDNQGQATAAQEAIVALGIPRQQTTVFQQATFQPTPTGATGGHERSWWDDIKQTLGIGFSEDEDPYYREGLQRGGTLLSVRADEAYQSRIIDLMNQHGAIDIDQRAAEWQRGGWTPEQQELRVPVVEEELRLGKRQLQSGGVRVYSHVTETPVEEDIRLREERVRVQRQPVDRPVAPGEAAFQEQSIELTETQEEPVVSKSARVKEEVVVKKEDTERTETVRDTVRRQDVEVEGKGREGRRAG